MELNRTKTKWIVLSNQNEILVGQTNPGFMPLEEFMESKASLKSYRGWKAAINGVLQSGACSVEDIEQNRIRVLPISMVIQIDDSYKEVPVSSYFKTMEIKRYVLTKKYKEILDLEDHSTPIRVRDFRYGCKYEYQVEWKLKDKYGEERSYYDDVLLSSDDIDELIKAKAKLEKVEKADTLDEVVACNNGLYHVYCSCPKCGKGDDFFSESSKGEEEVVCIKCGKVYSVEWDASKETE